MEMSAKLAVLTGAWVAASSMISLAADLDKLTCPSMFPLAQVRVKVDLGKTSQQKTEYRYTLENASSSRDSLGYFSLLGVGNVPVDDIRHPDDWGAIPSAKALSWFPVSPPVDISRRVIGPGEASGADVLPGAEVGSFVLTSALPYQGLVPYRVGIHRDVTDSLFSIDATNQAQTGNAEPIVEELTERCGGLNGNVPELFLYGVTKGPASVPTIELSTTALGIDRFLLQPVGDSTALAQVLDATSLRFYNFEKGEVMDVPVSELNSPQIALSMPVFDVDQRVLRTFSCRTSAVLVELVSKDGRRLARAALQAERLGLPGNCNTF